MNAGFCPDFSQFSYENIGASFEFRFSREWRFQSTIEPTDPVLRTGLTRLTSLVREQSRTRSGLDVLWEREF